MTEPRPQHSKDAEQAWDRIWGYAKILYAEHPKIDGNLRSWRRDGYPSSTSGGGRGDGPAVKVEADQHGPEELVKVTSVEASMFNGDQIADLHLRYETGVQEILGHFVQLWAIRCEVIDGPKEAQKAKKRQAELPKCANAHGCPDDAWGWKAGRCGSCYAYRRRTGRDRTGREDAA